MSLRKILVVYIAPVLGFVVYWLSSALAFYFNLFKKKEKLSANTTVKLAQLFSEIRFNEVKVIHRAFLPANIFSNKIAGMTYGNRIYTTDSDLFNDPDGFLTLIHEMVHVKQMQYMGQSSFSLQYGREFIEYGGYSDKMPLEKEAYEFVRNLKKT